VLKIKIRNFCLICMVLITVAAATGYVYAGTTDPSNETVSITIRGDKNSDKDEVLATIGDKVFTRNSIQWRIDGLPFEQQKNYQTEEQKKAILENLIQNHILALEAKKEKMDKEKGVVAALDDLVEYHLANVYIRYKLSDIAINDEEAKKYYEDHKAEFTTPAMVKAQHILIKLGVNTPFREEQAALKKANKIKKDLDKGADFSTLAKKSSDDEETKDKGGDIGYFSRETINPDIADAAFSLKTGEISKPVRSVLGYHIIKVTDKKEPELIPLLQVERKIKMTIFELKKQEVIKEKIKQLKEKYKVTYEK
jgi:peptidyl-prolyl cis-trans isomerase C